MRPGLRNLLLPLIAALSASMLSGCAYEESAKKLPPFTPLKESQASPTPQKTRMALGKPAVGPPAADKVQATVPCPPLDPAVYSAMAAPPVVPERTTGKIDGAMWIEGLEQQAVHLRAKLGETVLAYNSCRSEARSEPGPQTAPPKP